MNIGQRTPWQIAAQSPDMAQARDRPLAGVWRPTELICQRQISQVAFVIGAVPPRLEKCQTVTEKPARFDAENVWERREKRARSGEQRAGSGQHCIEYRGSAISSPDGLIGMIEAPRAFSRAKARCRVRNAGLVLRISPTQSPGTVAIRFNHALRYRLGVCPSAASGDWHRTTVGYGRSFCMPLPIDGDAPAVSAQITSRLDHKQLRSASWLASGLRTTNAALLGYVLAFLAGVGAAACTTLIDLNLRVPGHAILKSTLPIALGLALAPQRFSGLVISSGALGAVVVLKSFFGLGSGAGATASLLALGPLLDLFLWHLRSGWGVYWRFAAAGLIANCLAFAVRGGGKAAGMDSLSMRPWHDWLTVAPWTYAACGLVAGLVSSLLFFRSRRTNDGHANRH